jgi:Flp pilus assembly protein TadD
MQQRAFALDGSPLALRNLSQVETMLSLVDGAREQEHKRAALDYARRAVELATAQQRLSADYLHAYGIDLINVGDLDGAAVQLSRAAAMDPDAIRVLVNLGHALRRAGRPAEALPPLERAVHLEPRDTRAWADLAAAYEARGRRADALAAWRRVLTLVPNDPTASARVSALAAGP